MGVGKKTARKRAVGTREHIISYLTEVSELFDANGMASTRLAAAVGYPGSSVAFAQLLSGMERSGLIEREVRGKRTYRIRLGPVTLSARAVGPPRRPGFYGCQGHAYRRGHRFRRRRGLAVGGGPGSRGRHRTAGFDYDELARRLLVQVVRRLAAADPEASHSAPDRSVPDPDRSVPDPDRSVPDPDRSVPDPDRSVPARIVRPGSFRAAADGHRAGVRAGHGLDQARQAGRGERPAPGAAQRGAAVARPGRRAGPQGTRQHRPGQQRGRAAAAPAHLGRRRRGGQSRHRRC